MPFEEDGFLGKEAEGIARQFYEKHKEFFELCYDINRFGQQVQARIFERTEIEDNQKQIAAILFIRILEGAQAAILLANRGFWSETWVIIRVLFEDLCRLRIASNDMEFLSQYVRTNEINRLRIMKAGHKYPEKLPLLKDFATDDRMSEIDSRIKAEDIKKVTIRELAEKAGMDFEYHTLYSLASDLVHSSPTAWLDYVVSDASGRVVEILCGPRDHDTRIALIHVAKYLLDAIESVDSLFDLEGDGITDLIVRLEKLAKQEKNESPSQG